MHCFHVMEHDGESRVPSPGAPPPPEESASRGLVRFGSMILRNPVVAWLFRIAVGAVALALLVGPLALGYFTSRLNFTFGTRGLDPSVWNVAALQASLWVAAGIAFEAVFRRGLLERLRARLGTAAAIALHLLVLDLLLAPLLLFYEVRTDVLSLGQIVLYESLLQVTCTAAYLGFRSFLFSGCLHGVFAALRFTVINDVSGPFETLFFYAYSSEGFGWVLTLSPLLASSWVWLAAWVLRPAAVLTRWRLRAKRIPVERQAAFMGRLLYVSAAWTVAIKYVLPLLWALGSGAPLTTFILYWDAWWVAHMAVGWGLVRARRGIWIWALLLALVEIAIILAKLILFLRDPTFDFWTTNWFVNKCWLLAYFSFSLYWLSRPDVRRFLRRTSAA